MTPVFRPSFQGCVHSCPETPLFSAQSDRLHRGGEAADTTSCCAAAHIVTLLVLDSHPLPYSFFPRCDSPIIKDLLGTWANHGYSILVPERS